jgi:hypothetical protein
VNDVAGFFDRGFWQNIAADVAFALGSAAVFWLKQVAVRWFPQTHRTWNRAYLLLLFLSLVGANFYYLSSGLRFPLWFLFVSISICFALIWRELGQFWGIGLIGGDCHVANGLNYDKALRLCRNSLSFLGVGAAKLTRSKEFVPAMERCHRDNAPIRFLLVDPRDEVLRRAAEQKGVTSQDYQRKVEDSLRLLARLRLDRHFNIEVRFYTDLVEPLFRLMFINEQLCLVSYHVFGEGDGSQLPQMYVKRFEDQRDTDSFYYPFRLYFDRLWNISQPWNYELPIE